MHRPAIRPFIFLVAITLQVAGGRAVAQVDVPVAPADELSATVDHPLVPLASVATKVFHGTEVDETGQRIAMRVEETVLPRQLQVAGMAVTVVVVDDYHDEQLHDTTTEYFAQSADGAVYYVGERVDEYAHGTIVNHDGTWLAGDQGVQPGVFMPADPAVGDTFYQERVPDLAIDQATVIAVEQAITVPAGTFEGCVVTKDIGFPLGTTEQKTYCPGVGLVREEFLGGDLELVAFETTASADWTRADSDAP
jgi:hypothetical protein